MSKNIIKKMEKKIETILDNCIEFGNGIEGNIKKLDDVMIWLRCEWQAGTIQMDEYILLKKSVDDIGKKKIRDCMGYMA